MIKKVLISVAITAVMLVCLTSCNQKKEYCGGDAVFVSSGDVYVVGHVSTGSSKTNVPTLWKNGVAQSIGQMGNFNSANSVFVEANDVYIVITEREQHRVLLWKNGVVQQLGNTAIGNEVKSVFVSGGDVYVAGIENSKPTLWKNGVPQYLGYEGGAECVFVSGNDVYVAGYTGDYFQGRATIWKNGVAQQLSETASIAHSIVVYQGNAYIAGQEGFGDNQIATLWVNNVPQQLYVESVYKTSAYSLTVANDDVYVVGCGFTGSDYKNVALFWKNGEGKNIDDKCSNQASSVVVVDNNVYVAGNTINSCPLWQFKQ
jgi:hypothetical protein